MLDFLKKYKDLVEVITAIILSITALTVSCRANQIASEQAKLARIQYLPEFDFSLNIAEDSDGETLEIINIGGPVEALEAKAAVYIEVACGETRERKDAIEIPADSYYIMQHPTLRRKGPLITFDASSNRAVAATASGNLINLAMTRDEWCEAKVVRYIRLYYKSILGDEGEEYFRLSLPRGIVRLSSQSGALIFNRYLADLEGNFALAAGGITAESLYNAWKKSRERNREGEKE